MRRFVLLMVLALAPIAARAENGLLYVGAGVTDNSLSTQFSNPPPDLRSNAWKAFAGVRPLNWLAAEADYIDLGSGDSNTMDDSCSCTTHVEGSAWAGYAVGFIPAQAVDLFAKVGVAHWKLSNKFTDASVFHPYEAGLQSFAGTDFAWGIGAQVHFSIVGLRLEYEGFKVYGQQATVGSLSMFLNF